MWLHENQSADSNCVTGMNVEYKVLEDEDVESNGVNKSACTEISGTVFVGEKSEMLTRYKTLNVSMCKNKNKNREIYR